MLLSDENFKVLRILYTVMCLCRRDVLQPLSEQGGQEGCRVIAFDRPPYGLSERPLSWAEGPEGNPYTSEVGVQACYCGTETEQLASFVSVRDCICMDWQQNWQQIVTELAA